MAAKRYHIATPTELAELSEFAKDGKKSIGRMVSVWTAQSRGKGQTRWDNAFFADFCGTRRRDAQIVRIAADGEAVNIGTLQYNKALSWCEQHLFRTDG